MPTDLCRDCNVREEDEPRNWSSISLQRDWSESASWWRSGAGISVSRMAIAIDSRFFTQSDLAHRRDGVGYSL
jgi:hypothetical protein